MGKKFTGLTILVPEDIELLLANAREKLFHDCTQTEMICKLILTGLEAFDEEVAKRKQ